MPRVFTTALSSPRSDVSPPVVPPPADCRYLRDALDAVNGLEHRVRHRDVDDGVALGRKDAADLLLPDCPCTRSPEVVAPHEAAFEEVLSESYDVRVGELGGACILDVHERAVEEIVVAAAAHDEIFRIALAVGADRGLRELGEADAEVRVGAGVIRAPALAAGFSICAGVHQTAEVKPAVLSARVAKRGGSPRKPRHMSLPVQIWRVSTASARTAAARSVAARERELNLEPDPI